MSANPKSEIRARRKSLGSRKNRRANTGGGKTKAGENRKRRERPSFAMKRLNREAAAAALEAADDE
jgi:hypothetical protein